MILVPKKDFAKQCFLTVSNLGNYAKRKQVILSGDYVDLDIETNKIFLTKHSTKKEKGKPKPTEEELTIADPEYSQTKNLPSTSSNESSEDMSLILLNKQKIYLENQKKEREIAILEVRKQKLHGIVIPTELVKIIFTQHFKAVTAEFQNAADNLLMEIAKRKDFNRNELAELRGQLTDIINIAINKSVDSSKKTVENIVTQYSEKKEVGERE